MEGGREGDEGRVMKGGRHPSTLQILGIGAQLLQRFTWNAIPFYGRTGTERELFIDRYCIMARNRT